MRIFFLGLFLVMAAFGCQKELHFSDDRLVISSFTPHNPSAGDSVTVMGNGFLLAQSGGSVSINDLEQSFAIISDSLLRFIVTDSTKTGVIKLVGSGLTSISKDSIYIDGEGFPQVAITRFSPDSVNVGETVNVYGRFFGTNADNVNVSIGGVNSTIVSLVDTAMQIRIADATPSDKIKITHTTNGTATSEKSLYVGN